ncbi:hypothetical protein [Nitrosomonas ureae]|uniref:Uncharacterized protein n=1 Tax=Nitrosomonas ureae TaxID=44577 RepID=A0A0S3AJE7_9PROT|nr:hypothetical protein [Nitrosomonas ureae]ALQ51316.1 hypothetical protein ATY38_08840 [Nitrosomonas ureae]PXX15521.1 hypothetical protein C8R27_11060 [Nitrosomonas ureae]SDU05033.1 hypothetical protein SAMN05216406_12015 [Nitrosomonas ureae]
MDAGAKQAEYAILVWLRRLHEANTTQLKEMLAWYVDICGYPCEISTDPSKSLYGDAEKIRKHSMERYA